MELPEMFLRLRPWIMNSEVWPTVIRESHSGL